MKETGERKKETAKLGFTEVRSYMVKEEGARANLFLYLHKLFSADYEQFTNCLGLSGLCAGDTLAPNNLDAGAPVSEDKHR